MSGWKARIGYLSPSVFETPSDWDLILPIGGLQHRGIVVVGAKGPENADYN